VGIVAVLVLRAQAEWRQVPPGAAPPPVAPVDPAPVGPDDGDRPDDPDDPDDADGPRSAARDPDAAP
jgi:hypothetical protein